MTVGSVAQIGALSLDDQIKERRNQLANIERVLTTDTPGVTNRLADETHQGLIMHCRLLAFALEQDTAARAIQEVDAFAASVGKLFGGAE